MKNKKREKAPSRPQPRAWSLQWWHVAAGALLALLAALLVYRPALNGPFVFDDQYLPFFSPRFAQQSLLSAIQGVRPLLYLTFWLNSRLAGTEPYTYHLFNVLLHVANSLLVFFIARKILGWAKVEGSRREGLAAFAGAVFLLHPVQTEAVAYVASRSEGLSALCFYAAFVLFLYRRSAAISWLTSLGVALLYGAAALTKEHTVTLPALLLLTDYFWNPGFSFQGIRRNWRLYVPLTVVGAAGATLVWRVIRTAPTAGFHVEGLPWYDYFFTQWRALWVYFRLFLLPGRQNVDYAYPISRSLFDRGAVIWFAGLVLLVGLAIYFRRRYPLAAYGFLAALMLFAPTSSFIPIQDAVAERRLYLPMVALVLVAVEFLSRWKAQPKVVAGAASAVLAVLAVLCYQRNQVWAGDVPLWEDSVAKSPDNSRGHFQLGVAYYQQGRCDSAIVQFEAADKLGKPDYRLYEDWSLAEDCLNRPDQALAQLRRAITVNPNAYAYALLGMIYGKQNKAAEAREALDTALKLDPRQDMAYFYRGNLYSVAGDLAKAGEDYKRAIEINPENNLARRGLARIQSRLGPR